jgi:hypothetical protein
LINIEKCRFSSKSANHDFDQNQNKSKIPIRRLCKPVAIASDRHRDTRVTRHGDAKRRRQETLYHLLGSFGTGFLIKF